MELSGAEIIMGILEREGIETVAGIPGGANLPLYHALAKSRIRHVLARHEQGAGFIAQGMARSTGEAAVCFATSGPGVTNLLTAIADAKLDSVPIIAITGQVPRSMLGTDAFQEIDTYGLSIPIAKHSVLIESAAELLVELPRAFEIARSGRPGPVVVDVPKDVQIEKVVFDEWPAPGRIRPVLRPKAEDVAAILRAVAAAERPVIYAGAGVAASGGDAAATALAAFARAWRIPVTATLMGLGCFPPDDPLWLGMIGMHGTRAANAAVAESDLLIAIGARFDDRATGKLDLFAPHATVIHVDADAAELGKLLRPALAVHADAFATLEALAVGSRAGTKLDAAAARAAWERHIAQLQEAETDPQEAEREHPVALLARVAEALDDDAIVATDVGQHQMWAAQAIGARRPRSFLSSGGLGTMGFGLPVAIGAALANPGRRVLCVSGDGSLQMNIQELATLAELHSDVALLVLDNGALGLVRQQQELFYEERYSASVFPSRPDFATIATGFGVEAVDLGRADDPDAALMEALGRAGPVLIRVPIDAMANAFPMVPPGAANQDAIGDYACRGEPEGAAVESA